MMSTGGASCSKTTYVQPLLSLILDCVAAAVCTLGKYPLKRIRTRKASAGRRQAGFFIDLSNMGCMRRTLAPCSSSNQQPSRPASALLQFTTTTAKAPIGHFAGYCIETPPMVQSMHRDQRRMAYDLRTMDLRTGKMLCQAFCFACKSSQSCH